MSRRLAWGACPSIAHGSAALAFLDDFSHKAKYTAYNVPDRHLSWLGSGQALANVLDAADELGGILSFEFLYDAAEELGCCDGAGS